MTRRRNGTGTVSQTAHGWRVRLTLADGTRRDLGTHPTREEAESTLRGALAALADEHWLSPGGVSLRGFGRRWLDAREREGVRGVDRERSAWRAHVEPARFIDEPIATVTAGDVRRWVAELGHKRAVSVVRSGKGFVRRTTSRRLSRQTVTHALRILRGCFAAAVEAELCAVNVAADVAIRDRGTTEEGWTYLAPEEVRALLSCPAIPFAARTAYTVAIFEGLRQGELHGLHWTDVLLDGDRPELVVRYSYRGPRKGGRVLRIPLLAPARDALRHWRAEGPPSPTGVVFPSASGGVRRKDDDYGWADHPEGQGAERIVRPGHKTLAGITRPVRLHDLRHSCGSALVSGYWGPPWTLEQVRAFLGHRDARTTTRYAHLAPDALAAVARVTAVVPSVVPQTESPFTPIDGSAGISAARGARFERATFGSGGRRSIQLS